MFCSRQSHRRIDHVHEKGLRIVYQDYTSSFKELLIKDGSVCIHHRNIQMVAIEMYKVKNNLGHEILNDLFRLNPNPRAGRDFFRPNVNTVFMGEGSIRYFGPIVWNTMLPVTTNLLPHWTNLGMRSSSGSQRIVLVGYARNMYTVWALQPYMNKFPHPHPLGFNMFLYVLKNIYVASLGF